MRDAPRPRLVARPPVTGGYLHPCYADSLAEFGSPRPLPRSGGWILERPIPGSSRRDAMGCYPLFACRDWSRLPDDLDELEGGLVSLCVVTDPLSGCDSQDLRRSFRDLVRPFKRHFVIDLRRGMDSYVSSHHRRYARRALREMEVARCDEPLRFLDRWMELYAGLVRRHAITGIAAFSRRAFEKQLAVPGTVLFRAEDREGLLGLVLWYVQGDAAYYHLGAYSDRGYSLRASFGLFWRAIEHFADSGLRALALGAGAGLRDDDQDGLTRFKRGWSSGTRPAYLCGRILDPAAYRSLAGGEWTRSPDYFPAYRRGEFA